MKARDDMANQPNSLQPILCAHLLRQVDEKLIDLLSALAPERMGAADGCATMEGPRCGGTPA